MIKGHIHVKDYPWGNIVTHRDTYRKGRNKGLLIGLLIGSVSGFIIGLTTHGEASMCDREQVIFNHYATVADKIHGDMYRPDLLPPRPKPIRPEGE